MLVAPVDVSPHAYRVRVLDRYDCSFNHFPQGIYAYCTLNDGVEYTDSLKKELVMAVREQIGAFAAPDVIHWAPGTELDCNSNPRRKGCD